MGGTFDPPHLGHLVAGELAVEAFTLSKMLYVPAGEPQLKQAVVTTTPRDRLAMTQLAAEGNPRLRVSNVEISRKGPSYTIDTLVALRPLYPAAEFFLFVGMDNLLKFSQWREPQRILESATVVAMLRPTANVDSIPEELRKLVTILPIPLIDISSTMIRERMAARKTVRYLIPEKVEEYIRMHKLYQ